MEQLTPYNLMSPERRRAMKVEQTIQELEELRDELDPTYKSQLLPEKPKGALGLFMSRLAFWVNMLMAHAAFYLALFVAGLFAWFIGRAFLEKLLE